MIVVDSSAWIGFMRSRPNRARTTLHRLVEEGAPLATTEMIVMELLAGAASEAEAIRIRDHLLAFSMIPTVGLPDFETAAGIFRSCRRAGTTIRTMTDCLIAAITIRAGAVLLHQDRDFDVIARHAPLRVHPLDR